MWFGESGFQSGSSAVRWTTSRATCRATCKATLVRDCNRSVVDLQAKSLSEPDILSRFFGLCLLTASQIPLRPLRSSTIKLPIDCQLGRLSFSSFLIVFNQFWDTKNASPCGDPKPHGQRPKVRMHPIKSPHSSYGTKHCRFLHWFPLLSRLNSIHWILNTE